MINLNLKLIAISLLNYSANPSLNKILPMKTIKCLIKPIRNPQYKDQCLPINLKLMNHNSQYSKDPLLDKNYLSIHLPHKMHIMTHLDSSSSTINNSINNPNFSPQNHHHNQYFHNNHNSINQSKSKNQFIKINSSHNNLNIRIN